jgi:hypothetical protein
VTREEAGRMLAHGRARGADVTQVRDLLGLDGHGYIYRFSGAVTDASVGRCLNQVRAWRCTREVGHGRVLTGHRAYC